MNWQFVSSFGDSMLLFPGALLVYIVLKYCSADEKAAWHWALLFGGTCFVVCISKLAFMAWGIGSRELDFTGISGHSALSSCLFPVLFWLLCSRFSLYVRCLATLAGIVFVVLIGYSRLMVHAHSVSEVVSGLLLGMIACFIFLLLQGSLRVSWSNGAMFAVLVLQLVILGTGIKMPAQSLLGNMAMVLAHLERPYTRLDLNTGITPLPAQ